MTTRLQRTKGKRQTDPSARPCFFVRLPLEVTNHAGNRILGLPEVSVFEKGANQKMLLRVEGFAEAKRTQEYKKPIESKKLMLSQKHLATTHGKTRSNAAEQGKKPKNQSGE